MRILHVLDHSLPLYSGYAFRTISLLRESNALGYETLHLTSPKQGSAADVREEDVDGWHFFRTPPVRGLLTDIPALGELELMGELTARIEEVARRHRPHLIHAHSPVLNGIPALRVGSRLGIPVVYEIRAFWEDAAVDHGATREGSLRYRLTHALETFMVKRADHVVTICEGLRADLIQRGVPRAKITVVPNGVDVEMFTVAGAPDVALAAQLGLSGMVVLGFVGSFYRYEGLHLLLQALPRILESNPLVRVLLVGGGPQDENLRGQVSAMGLEDKVIFTGRVPHEQVNRYYDLIDILVYARESMRLTELVTPLKPLEAMAQGRLVLGSDVGGHRELMSDGRTAMLFKAGDIEDLAAKVHLLLRHPEIGPQMRAAARSYVETERTWKACVANYQEVYARYSSELRQSA